MGTIEASGTDVVADEEPILLFRSDGGNMSEVLRRNSGW